MHALVVDLAMLVLANALFLVDGSGYSAALLAVYDLLVVGLIAGWHGYAKRLRLETLDDLRLTFTSTAVATMVLLAIDALRSAEEPGVYPALQLWLLAAVLLAIGRLAFNLVVAWRRSSSRTAAGRPSAAGATSATSRRVEFVPMSTTATRTPRGVRLSARPGRR
jgi:FlaA1/EpsC-like NDP-sugar epimerase